MTPDVKHTLRMHGMALDRLQSPGAIRYDRSADGKAGWAAPSAKNRRTVDLSAPLSGGVFI